MAYLSSPTVSNGFNSAQDRSFVLSFRAPEWIKAKELGAGLSVAPNKSFHYDLYSWLPTCDEKDKYFVFLSDDS